MPRVAENPAVKKEMTKLKNCTKKYRKAVRAFYKTSAKLGNLSGPFGKKKDKLRKTLVNKLSKAQTKAEKIKNDCITHRFHLDIMMKSKRDNGEQIVIKEENREKIRILIDNLDKDEIEWSSNTSSDLSAMQ